MHALYFPSHPRPDDTVLYDGLSPARSSLHNLTNFKLHHMSRAILESVRISTCTDSRCREVVAHRVSPPCPSHRPLFSATLSSEGLARVSYQQYSRAAGWPGKRMATEAGRRQHGTHDRGAGFSLDECRAYAHPGGWIERDKRNTPHSTPRRQMRPLLAPIQPPPLAVAAAPIPGSSTILVRSTPSFGAFREDFCPGGPSSTRSSVVTLRTSFRYQ